MKKLLKLAAVFAAFALMFGFASCSDDDDDPDGSDQTTVAITGVTISGDATEVEVGKTITLTAAVAPENATVKNVTWTSSDEKVATVKDGVVTGVATGTVKITATSAADNTKKAEKTITVKTATNPGTTYSVSLYIPSLETGEYGEAETYNIGTSNTISAADLGTKLKQDKKETLDSFIKMVNEEDGTQFTIDDVELHFCSEKPTEESEPTWLTTINANTAVYVVPGVGDDDDAVLIDYTFDFAGIFATAPDGITYEANKLPNADAKISTSDVVNVDSSKVFVYSPSDKLRLRKKTYYINYNGTNANATDWAVNGTAKGDNDSDHDRYVGVNVSTLGATSGNIEVEFGIKVAKAQESDTITNAENGAVALIDKDCKILAVKTGLNFAYNGSEDFTIKATVPATTEKVMLVFSRGGAKKGDKGTGGIDVTSITAKTAN